MLRFLNNSVIRFLCVVVVVESCLMPSYQNECDTEFYVSDSGYESGSICYVALKFTNSITSMDKYLLQP